MDFGNIRKKFKNKAYKNIEEYIYDMNLVFDNCIKYNGSEHQVAKYAINIRNTFQDSLKKNGFQLEKSVKN